jgi:hypothetical protein
MLTRKELDLVEAYAAIVSNTFSFPFDWESGQLQPTKSKSKLFGVWVNFIAFTVYLVFVLVRYAEKTPDTMPFHAFSIICQAFYFFFHIHAFLYAPEMAALFNQLVYFNRHHGKFI